MALNRLSADEIARMNAKQREAYFMKYAGYFPDSPNKPYAIGVGSKTFMEADTRDLRQKFEGYARSLKMNLAKKENR